MYSVFKRPNGTNLAATYDTFDAAVAALQNRQSIVLPANDIILDPQIITTRGNSLYTTGGQLALMLAPTADQLFVYGSASVELWVSDVYNNVKLAAGNDTVHGGNLRDIIQLGDGDDFVFGGAGDDRLYGGNGQDVLFAGAGSDKLFGGAGQDVLFAGADNDQLYGGAGNDILHGRDGNNQYYGGTGADTFVIDVTGVGNNALRDFNIAEGDQVLLKNYDGPRDLTQLIADNIVRQVGDNVQLRYGDIKIYLINTLLADLQPDTFTFEADITPPPGPTTLEQAINAALLAGADEVSINDVIYRLRADNPLHTGFKAQDINGDWWSPDYLVVVAAGQSNMKGAAKGGDFSINANVIAYDWINGALVQASYDAAPAGGPGIRSGTTQINNLYFPFANEMAAASGQPVLVIARPVSGSPIETWLEAARDWSTPSWEAGENWAALTPDIDAALAAIGQSKIDAFIWHQGEGNSQVPTNDYVALLHELIGQVRGQSWGTADLPIIMGELSRRGVLFQQNAALQQLEIADDDPFLGFVSSAGLTPSDPSGVHFDGPSLVTFGARYFDTYQRLLGEAAGTIAPEPANAAPVLRQNAAVPVSITIQEGDTRTLNVSNWFFDADGDDLYYYSYLSDKKAWWADPDQATDSIVLTPGFSDAGTYALTIYANDYRLDGQKVTFNVTVTNATPTVDGYLNGNFDTYLESFEDFTAAQVGLQRQRGIDILDQSALGTGTTTIVLDSLTIRGAANISADFVFASDVVRIALQGNADFSVTGNALNNNITGNDAANDLFGLAGSDQLMGGAGNDRLFGGDGSDTLRGGLGNDLLNGGRGSDKGYGDAGADIFVFTQGDTFFDLFDFDYAAQGDRIRLQGFTGIIDYASLQAHAAITESSGRVIIDFESDRIFLRETALTEVTSDMFIFV